MNKPLKSIPEFTTEAEERAFWEADGNASTKYLDWSLAGQAKFPNLKPSTQSISRGFYHPANKYLSNQY